MKKIINKSNLVFWIAAIAALVGMIIYIVTSVTGYLTDAVMNPMPVICTVVAIIAAVNFVMYCCLRVASQEDQMLEKLSRRKESESDGD